MIEESWGCKHTKRKVLYVAVLTVLLINFNNKTSIGTVRDYGVNCGKDAYEMMQDGRIIEDKTQLETYCFYIGKLYYYYGYDISGCLYKIP